jgi:hypothetical protein
MSANANERENVSRHILPTSSTLLGLCFLILNCIRYLKVDRPEKMFMDKLVGVSVVLFLLSSLASYVSMRAKRKGEFYEKVADTIFLIGLFFVSIISVTTAFWIRV